MDAFIPAYPFPYQHIAVANPPNPAFEDEKIYIEKTFSSLDENQQAKQAATYVDNRLSEKFVCSVCPGMPLDSLRDLERHPPPRAPLTIVVP